MGWYSDAALTVSQVFPITNVTTDLNLYARWKWTVPVFFYSGQESFEDDAGEWTPFDPEKVILEEMEVMVLGSQQVFTIQKPFSGWMYIAYPENVPVTVWSADFGNEFTSTWQVVPGLRLEADGVGYLVRRNPMPGTNPTNMRSGISRGLRATL
jgi:uncharacterized repeat protein (TIGR02543 family)